MRRNKGSKTTSKGAYREASSTDVCREHFACVNEKKGENCGNGEKRRVLKNKDNQVDGNVFRVDLENFISPIKFLRLKYNQSVISKLSTLISVKIASQSFTLASQVTN